MSEISCSCCMQNRERIKPGLLALEGGFGFGSTSSLIIKFGFSLPLEELVRTNQKQKIGQISLLDN